jgi:dihydrofolate reductase
VWETMSTDGEPPAMRDYAEIWRAADKVVYSRTLEAPRTPRTRIERAFDPAAVRALKEGAAADLSVGGAELAGQALLAGLVDELELLLVPIVVGSGPRALPDGFGTRLDLLEQRTFPAGWVHLRYAVRSAP